jgi:hypothetical protein
MRYDEFEAVQVRFHELDRRLQMILLVWSVSVAALGTGIKLLMANAAALAIIP